VVVDARARRVFVMNTVGGVIWGGVERGASADEIVAELVARFQVTSEQAHADVNSYFDRLQAAGLAQEAEEKK